MASAREGDDGVATVRFLKGFGGFLTARPITFINAPPSEYACSVCGELVTEVRVIPCGHRICELCREVILEHPSTCCRCDSSTTSSTSTTLDLRDTLTTSSSWTTPPTLATLGVCDSPAASTTSTLDACDSGTTPSTSTSLDACNALATLSISDSTLRPKCCKTPKAHCPIDDSAFLCHRDYTVWLDTDPLMRAPVRCVNASEGCDFIAPLEDLEDHCQNECEYFVVIIDGRKPTRETRAEVMAKMLSQLPPGFAAWMNPEIIEAFVAKFERSRCRVEEIMLELLECLERGGAPNETPRETNEVDEYSADLQRDEVKTEEPWKASRRSRMEEEKRKKNFKDLSRRSRPQ